MKKKSEMTVLQTYKTFDNRVTIDVVSEIIPSGYTFPQADFSIVNTPDSVSGVENLYRVLYKSQKNNHISLARVFQPRKTRLGVLSSLVVAENIGWKFHDTITLVCQEPFKSLNSSLTQIGETTVLFTKTEDIPKANTEWFRSDLGDASNVWDLTPMECEVTVKKTVSRHFCLELGILLANLSSPMVARKFIVIGAPEISHGEFAVTKDLTMYCTTTDEMSAKRFIKWYTNAISSNGV